MIRKFTQTKNTTQLANFVYFLDCSDDLDFYFTENNSRFYIRDIPTLKKFLNQSCSIFYSSNESSDFDGIILVWKSTGGGIERYYVKLTAENPKIAEALVTNLLWNFNKDLFIKIRKDNKFLNVFKKKGFSFIGGRGYQVLLKRKAYPINTKKEITSSVHKPD